MTGSAEYAVNVFRHWNPITCSGAVLARTKSNAAARRGGGREEAGCVRRKRVIFFPASIFFLLSFFPFFPFLPFLSRTFLRRPDRARFQSWVSIHFLADRHRCKGALPRKGGRWAAYAVSAALFPFLLPVPLPSPLPSLPICPRWIDVSVEVRILLRTGVRGALNRIRVIEGAIRVANRVAWSETNAR